MTEAELQLAREQLHAGRWKDSEMADWARKWGQLLLDEIERLNERISWEKD